MEITNNYKETINLKQDTVLNYNIKSNSSARLFFCNYAGYITEININLDENSSCELYGFFRNDNNKNTNVITNVIHKGKKSKCNQDFRFVNKDSSSSFEGKITIPKDISGCESHMLNKNLLLDDTSKAFSKPELDINNDDTICTHGSTTGPIDEEQIFYIQSRGLSYEDSVNMLIEAFYQDIKSKMEGAVA